MKVSFPHSSQWLASFSFRAIRLLWYRTYRRILVVLFVCVSGFGGWFWYYSLHQYEWTSAEKKSFLESHAKETEFRASHFEEAVENVQQREEQFGRTPVLGHDLFHLDQTPKSKPE